MGRRRRAAGAVVALAIAAAGALAVTSSGEVRTAGPTVQVVETTRTLSERLARRPPVSFATADAARGLPVITVDDAQRYQRVVGAGAAITDTSAWLLHDELSASTAARVIADLFGPGGIRLDAVLVPIGASDFTRNGVPYSYDDVPPGATDPGLSNFSIAHDVPYILPTLRQVLAADPATEVLAAPWSPPGWMKSNDALGNPSGHATLLPGAYGPFARYFVRFIQAYAAQGVPVAGVAPQNEPGQRSVYPGLDMTTAEQARFIVSNLAPALAAAGLHVRIYAHDYKWLFWQRVKALLATPGVERALAGVAWHCYEGDPDVMTAIHRLAPRLDQIESECATGLAPGPPAEMLIASFRNWATTALMWNLALDPHGGPVQPPNYGCRRCVGVITVDERRHTVTYGPDYYQLGQFSTFVDRGAWRIASNNFVTYNTPVRPNPVPYTGPGIDDVAFQNPDGSLVLIVHENGGAARRVAVRWRGMTFSYSLPGGATVTFVWK